MLCPRSPSPKEWGSCGYYHVIDENAAKARRQDDRLPPPPPPQRISDWEPRLKQYDQHLSREQLETLAVKLRVRASSLGCLRIGYSHQYDAFTFPMYDADGKVIGVRLRSMDGTRKFSVNGSRNGLFIPGPDAEVWNTIKDIWIVEGPTDAAAMIDFQLYTIGRPSCSAAVEMTCKFARGKRVCIVGNYDETKYRTDGTAFWPGQQGAAVLANAMLGTAADVRVIYPRNGHKDVREWKRHGATEQELHLLRENATAWSRREVA